MLFVLNFIQPVLRRARRFPSGFTTESPSSPTRSPSLARSSSDSSSIAIIESEGDEEVEYWAGDANRVKHHSVDVRSCPDKSDSPSPSSPTHQLRQHDAKLPLDDVQGAQIHRQMVSPTDQPISGSGPSPATTSQTFARADDVPALPMSQHFALPPLPEDDGMRPLRRRIYSIQARNITADEKARLMHLLLSEGHTKSQLKSAQTRNAPPRHESPVSPPSPIQSGLSGFPYPLQSLKSWDHFSDGSAVLNMPLTEDDLKPTYVPAAWAVRGNLEQQLLRMEVEEGNDELVPELGCAHYKRNVKMQCAMCEKWYTCRLCHDAAENHELPRKETKNMLCMLCGCAQKASDTCIKCGTAAYYYCSICKLWNDDANKAIYHCQYCDICRIGQGLGKDFFHCQKCRACIAIAIEGRHKCIEGSTDRGCPICGEYMFSSPRQVVFMKCGHSIHRDCYDAHMKTSYKCPICSKSCVNMETQFCNLEIAIVTQPMPPEYVDVRAIISCNDCSARSQTRYHWLGLKCSICNSFNTVQHQLNMPSEELSRRVARRQSNGTHVADSQHTREGMPVFSPLWFRNANISQSGGATVAPNESVMVPETDIVDDDENVAGLWGCDEQKDPGSASSVGMFCEDDPCDECKGDISQKEENDKTRFI